MLVVNGPLVSVVVAVYNGEETLGEALESLFAQEYDPFEVIVVDDGSTDGSSEVARAFPKARCLRQPNQGPGGARNAGIAVARGDFVAFLDADDRAPSNKLGVQAGYLLEHPEVGCVLGRQEITFRGIEPPTWFERDPVFGDLEGICYTTAMLRRGALETVGGFNADRDMQGSEDRDLMVRLRAAGVRIDVLSEIVVHRTFHGSNLTLQHPGSRLLASLRAKLENERASAESGATE